MRHNGSSTSPKVIPLPHALLEPHLKAKKAKRPNFSLRALAGMIEVSPSYMSQVVSGKKIPSVKTIEKLRTALEIEKSDYSLLEKSVAFYSTQSKQIRELIAKFAMEDLTIQSQAAHEKQADVMQRDLDAEDVVGTRIIGATLAVDPSKVDAFVQKMNEFLFNSIGFLSEGTCSEVYLLNLQFVPLTKAKGGLK